MKPSIKIPFLSAFCLSFLIFATSCKSEKKNDLKKVEEVTEDTSFTGDNSMNALDWDGTYEGQLPCADCEGIATVITINQDKTYTVKETYQGKSVDPITSTGTFSWDDSGQRIVFSENERHHYFVGENTLTQLNEDGQRIQGDMAELYVLRKIQNQLTGKKWHLAMDQGKEILYKEAANEHAYLQFNDDNTINGYTGCNNLQGVYSSGDAQTLKFSELLNTLKACPEMEIESRFLKIVNTTAAYAFENQALVLYDKDHQKLATFKAAN